MKAPFQFDRIYPIRPRAQFDPLRQDLEVLIAAAKDMGICGQDATAETLAVRPKKIEWLEADKYILANDFALTLLKNIAADLDTAHRHESLKTRTGKYPTFVDAIGKEHELPAKGYLLSATQTIAHLAGYLSAIEDVQEERTRLASEKRRQHGSASRERLREAAEEYRGKVSRDDAASKLAARLGKSAGTLRRQLSEEFPGESWTKVAKPLDSPGSRKK